VYRNTEVTMRFFKNNSAKKCRQNLSPISQKYFRPEMSHLRSCSTSHSGGPSRASFLKSHRTYTTLLFNVLFFRLVYWGGSRRLRPVILLCTAMWIDRRGRCGWLLLTSWSALFCKGDAPLFLPPRLLFLSPEGILDRMVFGPKIVFGFRT
jgi:hypothetical protein